jgi:hypothetical protein
MNPQIKHKSSENNPILDKVVSCISCIECFIPEIVWASEYQPNNSFRDSIDLFGKGNDFVVAIELDKTRADQVAKKFVSRMAIIPSTVIYFISLCYPGTDKMNHSETSKYFEYCATLARRMSNYYADLIIQNA